MKIYLATEPTNYQLQAVQLERAPRILLSYALLQKSFRSKILNEGFFNYLRWADVILDSGAYSAYMGGTPIDLGAYADFIVRNQDWISAYVALDVVGDVKATHENLELMEQAGFSPLPVLQCAPINPYVEQYVEKYDRLLVGGINKGPYAHLTPQFLGRVRRAGTCKVHLLGKGGPAFLEDYLWADSGDSSGWCVGPRYGAAIKFDHSRGRIIRRNGVLPKLHTAGAVLHLRAGVRVLLQAEAYLQSLLLGQTKEDPCSQ